MYTKILEQNPLLKNANIIIVDDNEVSLTVIKSFFAGVGFTNLHLAVNGKEALEKIRTMYPAPDLIITDIYMPELDGYGLIKELREIKTLDYIPIIVQTSTKEQTEINKAFAAGASDVISKPVQKPELLSRSIFYLENVFFRKRIEEELNAGRELQLLIMPREDDIISLQEKYNIELAAHLIQSSELGGDFWGFRNISHSELGIYTADISGHGVSAALNTFRVHGALDDPNNFFSSSNLFLKKLNKRMCELMPVGQFSTMFYGVINTDEDFIQYSSAASAGGLLLRKNGSVENLKTIGVPLGASSDANYDATTIPFTKGDSVILFSDALVETANEKNEFLSEEKIKKILFDSKELSAGEILKNLLELFKQHLGGSTVTDDLTINIYKRL
jgi:phosphoserine phosphatase RsbU/P